MSRPRQGDDVSRLVSQIEAELSSGSRAALRSLLSKLTAGDDDERDDDPDEETGGAEDEAEDFDDDPGPWAWRSYARAAPIRVEGGLAARSRRGEIGESWWSKRFLAAIESALVGGRLARGRTYARRGQVMELRVEAGLISARVQGSRPAPYKVRIAMPAVSADKWEAVLVSLASQAVYAASMLAGQLPHEIEEVFAGAKVELLPSRSSRLSTDCTCPDWANPCKHVAAVCYLVAEQFDRDPFALLAWRGREREAVLQRLRELRGGGPAQPAEEQKDQAVAPPPLADCILGFWKAGPELASVHLHPVASDAPAAVLRQLPAGHLEVRGRDLSDVLGPAYVEMAAAARRRAIGAA